MKELEVERDGLKTRTEELAKEKDTVNYALMVAQANVLDKDE